MRVAALILAVAVLGAGVLVAWSINRASDKTIIVQITTPCKGGYGSRC